MTIQTSYVPATSQGDGISTAFPVPWQYQFNTDLVVSTTVVATGIVTPLVLGTNYSVSPTSNSPAATGTVLLTVALPVGTDLTIARNTSVTQVSRWVPNFSNPALLYENAVDKLTLIQQEVDYAISILPDSGGGGLGIVTTAVFNMASIGSSQNVVVNSVTGLAVGNTVQISNVANTLIGQILVITTASLTLTIKTVAITAGVVGNTMPIGSPVQLGVAPGTTTIQVTDAITSPVAMSTQIFSGNATTAALYGNVTFKGASIDLYIDSASAGNVTIKAYAAQVYANNLETLGGLSDAVAGWGYGTDPSKVIHSLVNGGVLNQDGLLGTGAGLQFTLLTDVNITPGSLTPALLNATNSPTNTQIASFDSATGHFKWINSGGSGLPAAGNAGMFLVGPSGSAAWSQWLNTSLGDGAFFFGNSTATNAYAGFLSQKFATPAGANIAIDIGVAKFNGTNWLSSSNGIFNFWGGIAAKIGGTGAYTSIDASLVETAIFGNTVSTNFITDIVRAGSFRGGAGYWEYAFTVNNPGAATTVDLKNGSYQRHTGITTNITITLADSTPAPTNGNFQYANELTLEINAPGANTYTWPGTVTWANGASAPVLSTTGINILKFIRRQGQTQWVGCIINPVAGGSSYTDAQARSAVLSSTYLLNSASVGWTIIPGVSAQPFIQTTSVTNAMLAGSITGNKLSGFPSNAAVYLDGTGNWTTPAGSGGFSTAAPHTWTGVQTYNVQQLFNSTFAGLGASTIATSINNFFPNISFADAAAINIEITDNYSAPPGAGGIKSAYINRTVTVPINGTNSFYNGLNVLGAQSSGFNIGFTTITQSARLSGAATADGVWLNSWSPDSRFAATPDAQGIIHSFSGGYVRIGEINHGNAWADLGKMEFRAGQPQFVCGLEFFPDWLAGATGDAFPIKYNVQWAICIGSAPQNTPGSHGVPTTPAGNWIGILMDKDGIVQGDGTYGSGGYGLSMWGSVALTNPAAAGVKLQGKWDIALDCSLATISAETTSTHNNQAAIQLAQGQAICFKPPTGANTGVYIVYNGTNLRVTKDGGNTWTNLV